MPIVSEAQRRAMHAAKEGRSTLGIPKKVGAEFVAAGKEKAKLPEKVGKKYELGGAVGLQDGGVAPATPPQISPQARQAAMRLMQPRPQAPPAQAPAPVQPPQPVPGTTFEKGGSVMKPSKQSMFKDNLVETAGNMTGPTGFNKGGPAKRHGWKRWGQR